jgi:hypothetical protein
MNDMEFELLSNSKMNPYQCLNMIDKSILEVILITAIILSSFLHSKAVYISPSQNKILNCQ